MKKTNWVLTLSFFVLFLFLSACGSTNDGAGDDDDVESGNETDTMEQENRSVEPIDVTLKNSDGDNVGTAELEGVDEGVKMTLDATHLPPGTHAIHFHETGSCEAPDFKSAGDHFNPTEAEHGLENTEGPHAGDLPNIEVAEDGTVKDEIVADMVTLEKGEDNSLLDGDGTALVIHADEDDNKSQPAGDAGDRIVCGEIAE
ncbi:superoxide dismutase family protein [Virgibacillus sp. MSJ-26]|uniref:superoxide dismutase family protein n=1 Tax=Virgibacillus sp. MSJ-26 TaxID=2841522 RepID=UPI0020A183F5|nr:superoxide dismutase family protein [Virgibacillus sp. MSJ-26]